MEYSKHHHHHHPKPDHPREENNTGIRYTAKEMREVTKVSSEDYLEKMRAQVNHIEKDIMNNDMLEAASKGYKHCTAVIYGGDYSYFNKDVLDMLIKDFKSLGYKIEITHEWKKTRGGYHEIDLKISWR